MEKLNKTNFTKPSNQQQKTKPIQRQGLKPQNSKSDSFSSQNKQIQTISLLEQPKKPSIRQFVYMPNVQFYLNKMSSSPNGTFIDLMHKHWWGNYILLETNHSYIQWLFPNSFQSRFNQAAKALTKQQAKHFRENIHIAKRYVHSYQMILQFFGMKLRNRITGEVTRTIVPRYKDRYDETLLSAYHNHLRITRILCSLTEVGFAFYARQLCKHLKRQIYEHNGRLIRLKHMDVYKHWRPFEGDHKKRSNQIDIEDIPNIYLRQLWKQEGYKPLIKQRSKWSEIFNQSKPTIVLEDQSGDQKNQAKQYNQGKNQQGNQDKNQSKQQTRQISLKQKIQHKGENIIKGKDNIKKIELQTQSNQQQSEDYFTDSEESQFQQEIDGKQYGRRGSKQYQKTKRELEKLEKSKQLSLQKDKIMWAIRKQEEYEKKLEAEVKSRLAEQTDNPTKRQMAEIRKIYADKLKNFGGARRAETIEQRQKRMMQKGKHTETINGSGQQFSSES